MDRVLLVDDDVQLCKLLSERLATEGYAMETVHDGARGLERALSMEYALVVLDLMLPRMGGLDVLRRLRKVSPVPVLILTARGEDSDRILGLEMGADDYVPKPFNPRELIARIRAILRRTSQAAASPGPLVIGDLCIDPAVREAWLEDTRLHLTSAEFTLLEVFMREPGRVLSREQLTDSVLGRNLGPFDRVIDVHVSNCAGSLVSPKAARGSRLFAAAGTCSHRDRMQRMPIMGSLFLKIFFWFWATVIATGVALILTFIIEPRSVPSRWHTTLTDTARYSGIIAIETAEREGVGPTSAYLERIAHETHMTACLFDSAGKVIACTGCQDFLGMTSHVTASKDSDFSMRYGIARVALLLTGQSGRDYIFATELPAGPRAALGTKHTALLLQWGVAFLVSGLICSLLTRYLTAPILRLQEMSQELAAGNLSVRAGSELVRRRDEIGNLVRDFNAMASRIGELISRQRQLTSDVSHELRSPLARLNVALDLARGRKGNDPAFEQMEEDLRLLDGMIGRLLTIAKLDISAPQVPMTHVDLADLLSQIVRNAEFESREPNGGISLISSGECLVWGSAELLHSAIENVIRNAIRHTDGGTAVEISLQCESLSERPSVRLVVRDYGPGIPASELKSIFQPFYRVAAARDRQSGGTGLGLAIADRVVRIHGGTIRAENATPRGLRIEIVLPQSSAVQSGNT